MAKTQVILVGGFLGAGKTTLLLRATERLIASGKRVGLVTNDQAAKLVDTAVLKGLSDAVQEVAGGCFCCRFDEFTAAMERLIEAAAPDVLMGEPVGSCTDLSATVLQPLKSLYKDKFRLAPFSVLVDAKQVRTLQRLRKSMGGSESARFPENVMYIYEQQLEEADLILLNKADLVSPGELAEVETTLKREFTQAPVLPISALRGSGVDAWLDRVLASTGSGRTIAQVNYDQYAAGEAALGWLNAEFRLRGNSGIDGRAFCTRLLGAMREDLQEANAEIAHLKLHLAASGSTWTANLTGNDAQSDIRGDASVLPRDAVLLINVRAKIAPGLLRDIVNRQLAYVAGPAIRIETEDLQSFSPARPTPTHRFSTVIEQH